MSWPDDEEAPEGWTPMPPDQVWYERRVVTRRAADDTWAWFRTPDPSGYAGIGLALMDKAAGVREFWIWTDESDDRTARIVRLGYRRYVVELCAAGFRAAVEDPRRAGRALPVTDEEGKLLGRDAISPERIFSSSITAESCASMWLNHGLLHDRYALGD
ncbi:hypothetical protein [Microbacterium sp. SCN 69-37]|uniref:hypothetical protein n=1 Tax=Microbacterium sp. SCN 69-37 TaxID=1660115 RepID=UPI0025F9BCE5|nr:hypothetical protein [Microbacterium sp. SCN 69-37]